ncbi:MAG: orotate phosphoribosyltransferase [Armatimonadota bacterium]
MEKEKQEIINIFKENSALLTGHFLLSSGLHSDTYFQCALLFEKPHTGELLSKKLAELFKDEKPDIVIGPAIGGIILAYETAKHLNAKAAFTERENGVMRLRRGFKILKDEKVLIVEDVLTTGKSTKEVIEVIKEAGGRIIGIGSLINRSSRDLNLPVEPKSLLKIEVKNYDPSACPLCAEKIPLIKPGSRN